MADQNNASGSEGEETRSSRPPQWVIDATQSALQSAQAQFFQSLLEPIQEQITEISRSISSHFWDSISLPWQNELRDTVQRIAQDFQVLIPLFRDAGFWITSSMPLGLLRELRLLYDSGTLTDESLKETICSRYRQDDCALLRAMVHSWEGEPYFAVRINIFNDALEAHAQGKYALSIPALLPHVEGISSGTTGLYPRYNAAIGQQQNTPMHEIVRTAMEQYQSTAFHELTQDLAIAYMQQMAYANVPFQDLDNWLNSQSLTRTNILQRHAILHGHQIDYASEANSLRSFFLLDTLYHVIRRSNMSRRR